MTKKATKHSKKEAASSPLKRLVVIAAVLLSVFIFLQYLVLPIFLKQAKVREHLIAVISSETQGTVQFSSLNLKVFPSLSFQIRDLVYESKSKEAPLSFQASLFKARLSLIALIEKKIRLKDLTIKNASLAGKTRLVSETPVSFSLQNFNVDARGIRDRTLGSFRARGKLLSENSRFEITGFLHLGDLANFKLEDALCDLSLKLSQVPLEPLVAGWHKNSPLKIIAGQVSGNIQIIKKTSERKGEWLGNLNLENVLYTDPNEPTLNFPKTSYKLESEGGWDFTDGKVHVAVLSSRLLSDGLKGEFAGDMKLTDKGLSDFNLHIAFDEFNFDRVNLYYPFLGPEILNQIHLKGTGEIRFQARGNPSSFILHGETILTETSLESSYFTKTAGVPLNFIADVRFEKETWRGSFELRYRELKSKGTLLGWTPSSEQLEFTFLTNKFRFATFLEAIPTSAAAQFWKGDVKVLLNYKGKATDPENARIYGVINLEGLAHWLPDFSFHTPALTATLKVENTEVYAEKSFLDYGSEKAKFQLEWRGWNAPRIEWRAISETLPLDILWRSETSEAPSYVAERLKRTGVNPADDLSRQVKKQTQITLPLWLEKAKVFGEIETKDLKIGPLSLGAAKGTILLEKGRWELLPTEVNGREGSFWVEAQQDWHTATQPSMRVGGKNIKLNGFSEIAGQLSFNMDNQKQSSVFEGSVLVQKGEFKNFSLLSTVPGSRRQSPVTSFQELGAQFQLDNQKTNFKNLFLNSKDLIFKGEGSWLRDGSLSFKGDLLLNKELSRELQPQLASSERLTLPLLAEGFTDKVQLKAESGSEKRVLEKDFLANTSKFWDGWHEVERQGPRHVSVPDKVKFLEGSVGLAEKEEPAKAGFFETLFGRRN